MMGNVSIKIDFSLVNIWRSWFNFYRGKRKTIELERFRFYLEDNLWQLYCDLNEQRYFHGEYHSFVIYEGKRRDIMVAGVKDRVVHRLVYDFLVSVYDKTFIYDLWSCRQGKGLLGAIERAQLMVRKYRNSFVWRADISKFFDNVNQAVLLQVLSRKIVDQKTIELLVNIIKSHSRGIPIGNLSSQIFSNIYLNELDRFVKYVLKPQFYLRYGDDFIIIAPQRIILENMRFQVKEFLNQILKLTINHKNDIIIPIRQGVYFLGVNIYPTGRCLKRKVWVQVQSQLDRRNIASYSGLIQQHSKKKINYFNFLISKLYD